MSKLFTATLNNSCTALCSSLRSLGQIVNCKKPLEISVTVYISKPQYYRARDQVWNTPDLYVLLL